MLRRARRWAAVAHDLLAPAGMRARDAVVQGAAALRRLHGRLESVSLVALLTTLVMLFGFQGEPIIAQPLAISLRSVPILIQACFNSTLAYLLNRASGEGHRVAGPPAP